MKVAIVHDWLTGMRGGERVLEAVLSIFPKAPIYTLIHFKGRVSSKIESHRIITSFIQKIPFINWKNYRSFLPLFPLGIESFNMNSYDLVISLSHCVAHGILTGPKTYHINYSFTPMRYIWDQYWQYFNNKKVMKIKRGIIFLISHYLRQWDQIAAQRPDKIATISNYVRERIKKYYKRNPKVIYPPVDTDYFTPGGKSQNYYLIVSALSPYKKIDIAIEAFNKLRKPLIIIGWGPEKKNLTKLARDNIKFLGQQSDEVLLYHYRHCKALIFPSVEDYGLTPLEANACGKPVIALKQGGALETIKENLNGIFFNQMTSSSIIEAVKRFEDLKFDETSIRQYALKFNIPKFIEKMKNFIDESINSI